MNQLTNWNNLNKSLLFVFLIVFAFSCKTDNSKSTEIKKDLYNVDAIGEIKNGSYTFCGTVPTEVNYTYRTGNWKFITKEKIKIAEGEYDVIVKENDSSGGCAYKYFVYTNDLKKWKFWNVNGDIIKPTERLINMIESEQIKFSVYLE